ncbi:hypothetical protein H7J93_01975 [Mycobacterium barrassiae]|nr:hypothetical protein [Mycobacterium barrassiae]
MPLDVPDLSRGASLRIRLTAFVFGARLDHLLAVGGVAAEGTALGVRAARLTSERERHSVARTLRRALHEARLGHSSGVARVAVHRAKVVAVADVIDTITLRLHSPRPVRAMGMARLRRLISDGAGPMYARRKGDLDGRLRAALAAL